MLYTNKLCFSLNRVCLDADSRMLAFFSPVLRITAFDPLRRVLCLEPNILFLELNQSRRMCFVQPYGTLREKYRARMLLNEIKTNKVEEFQPTYDIDIIHTLLKI